jgi:hypothetical protein
MTPYTPHTNVGKIDNQPEDNTIPPWILPCSCLTIKCTFLSRLRPNIIYIQGAPCKQLGPHIPTPHLTIQIIEFTYTYIRYTTPIIETKRDKYNPLIEAIKTQGWQVNFLMLITTRVHGSIHTRSIELLCLEVHLVLKLNLYVHKRKMIKTGD